MTDGGRRAVIGTGCRVEMQDEGVGGALHRIFGRGLVVAAGLGFPAGLYSDGPELFQPAVLALGALVALLSAVIPYSLEMAALARLPAATVALLLCLEPVIAAGAGLIVLGETLSLQRWAGIGCICAATAVATVRNTRNEGVPAAHTGSG